MQEILGSVRRSLVFRSPTSAGDGGVGGAGEDGTIVDRINSCLRKSRVFSKPSPPRLPPQTMTAGENAAAVQSIRWRKGELIGCGAFGQVYMGMNLDSGELLAVKQVLIPANSASKEKAQVYVQELEEEVKLLKNLSHPNIVRYLGTVREEETLNILLEFVPGGSISSLLGKFGSFPESVIRMYTKQLLLGLDYLHKNGIMHRDIKGANILVDNKGCIKLADFGASKQATVSGAKSMKGTPYWMAPEVIRQTGHRFSADIWSVGCTVIEMATGKTPWSQQYKEVAAFLFYIGTTKEHPPIPEFLSAEAKDFLLKCLEKEPELRPSASELLQHPFVTGEILLPSVATSTSVMKNSEPLYSCGENLGDTAGSDDVCNLGSLDFSTINCQKFSEGGHSLGQNRISNEICQIDEKDNLVVGKAHFSDIMITDESCKSFNPICEPCEDWTTNYDASPEVEKSSIKLDMKQEVDRPIGCSPSPRESKNVFSFCSAPSVDEDDDEVTESKIRAFLVEKALELKKLQSPLLAEYHNSFNPLCSPNLSDAKGDESASKFLKLPPKSRSPSRTPSTAVESATDASPGSSSRRVSHIGVRNNEDHQQNLSPQTNDLNGNLADTQEPCSPNDFTVMSRCSVMEIQRKWKEELDQELERKREMMRQAGMGGKTSSPKDRALNRPRERSRFASPGK
nr:mitogen-activated protein kinase kinase kinase ANP1-like isoform X2 [Coffea arabica]